MAAQAIQAADDRERWAPLQDADRGDRYAGHRVRSGADERRDGCDGFVIQQGVGCGCTDRRVGMRQPGDPDRHPPSGVSNQESIRSSASAWKRCATSPATASTMSGQSSPFIDMRACRVRTSSPEAHHRRSVSDAGSTWSIPSSASLAASRCGRGNSGSVTIASSGATARGSETKHSARTSCRRSSSPMGTASRESSRAVQARSHDSMMSA